MGKTTAKEVKNIVENRVKEKAYELYEQHGCQDGHDQDNWFEAEKIVEDELHQKK